MFIDAKTLLLGLSEVNAKAKSLCEGLSGDQLAWRPKAGGWSIAENLIHLCITTQTFLPAVDHALAESLRRQLTGGGPFRLGLYGRMLVRYVEPPPLIRLPAPKPLRPLSSIPPERALEDFFRCQAAMQLRMKTAEGINLTGLRFPSPLASYVKMNLLEFFSVFNGHSRRHLWQGTNVRRTIPLT